MSLNRHMQMKVFSLKVKFPSVATTPSWFQISYHVKGKHILSTTTVCHNVFGSVYIIELIAHCCEMKGHRD